MKAFSNDGDILCGACYLDRLNDCEYPDLMMTVTSVIDVGNDEKCPECGYLFGHMDALNSFKKIIGRMEAHNIHQTQQNNDRY